MSWQQSVTVSTILGLQSSLVKANIITKKYRGYEFRRTRWTQGITLEEVSVRPNVKKWLYYVPVPQKELKSLILSVIQIVTCSWKLVYTYRNQWAFSSTGDVDKRLHSKLEKILLEERSKKLTHSIENKDIVHKACCSWATVGTIFTLEDASMVYWSKALTTTQAEVWSERGIIYHLLLHIRSYINR